MSVTFLEPSYVPWTVVAAYLIAFLTGYATIDLVKRIWFVDGRVKLFWWLLGSLILGTGIWSMHFVGMQGFRLPIELGYSYGLTFLSWAVVVMVQAAALYRLTAPTMSLRGLIPVAILLATGLCSMHYLGIAALDMQPGIQWNWYLVGLSALVALAVSFGSMRYAIWIRYAKHQQSFRYQLIAAAAIGLGIWLMHYVGMLAANFPADSVCLSADQISDHRGGELALFVTLLLLCVSVSLTTFDNYQRSHSTKIIARLEEEIIELRQRAFHDPLTALPNRSLLEDRYRHAVERCNSIDARRIVDDLERRTKLALLFVDLDGFKPINDTHGHSTGDKVLLVVARRLKELVRQSDTVARLGGDEFVLLIEDVFDVEGCRLLVARLVEHLAEPIYIDGQSLNIQASVGVAVYPDHGSSDMLMDRADAAMYAAKRSGGNCFVMG